VAHLYCRWRCSNPFIVAVSCDLSCFKLLNFVSDLLWFSRFLSMVVTLYSNMYHKLLYTKTFIRIIWHFDKKYSLIDVTRMKINVTTSKKGFALHCPIYYANVVGWFLFGWRTVSTLSWLQLYQCLLYYYIISSWSHSADIWVCNYKRQIHLWYTIGGILFSWM